MGFTISADHQLMIVDDGAIRASMLRGPRFNPTKVVRNGQTLLNSSPVAATYVFTVPFTSGQGDWAAQKPWRAGMSLSSPLIPVMSADTVSHKPLPAEQSFVSLQADNLVVTALKKSSKLTERLCCEVLRWRGLRRKAPYTFLRQESQFRRNKPFGSEFRRSRSIIAECSAACDQHHQAAPTVEVLCWCACSAHKNKEIS